MNRTLNSSRIVMIHTWHHREEYISEVNKCDKFDKKNQYI